MRGLLLFVVGISFSAVQCYTPPPPSHTNFPKGFLFGSATSSYQVEGAWNDTDKGENIWDHVTHFEPELIVKNHNGDVAADSFHKYKEDVQLMKEIGFQVYRFSLSWARLLPTGRVKDGFSTAGVQYYDNLIDELLANGIQPMVTIFHWDLPQALQEDNGGWLNPKISDYFVEYADFVFSRYASKVKYWITINEPLSVVTIYSTDVEVLGLKDEHGIGDYISGHNLLLAHSKVYHLYQAKYSHNGGKLSMSFCGTYCAPKTNSIEDIAAAERCYQFQYGWFLNPVFYGDYHPILRAIVDENSRWEGRNESRLPYFTEEETRLLKNTVDFVGLNYYSMRLASPGAEGADPSFTRDMKVINSVHPSWKQVTDSPLWVAPEGIRMVLNKVKNDFGNPMVIITENGVTDDTDDPFYDPYRIDYYERHFAEIRRAIYEDGCNVVGHISWSLMDNFEWLSGYTLKYGLIHVDFNDPERKRTMKQSAYWLKHYIAMHSYL